MTLKGDVTCEKPVNFSVTSFVVPFIRQFFFRIFGLNGTCSCIYFAFIGAKETAFEIIMSSQSKNIQF